MVRQMVKQQKPLRTVKNLPSTNNPAEWRAYLQSQKWRREPEIVDERKQELDRLRKIKADFHSGTFPFGGQKLTRADVEWLLVTHRDGNGPVNWCDPDQDKFDGLDLRGADLRDVDLSYLPLSKLIGGLSWFDWRDATVEQRDMAAIRLDNTYMLEAHLEGASLRSAHLEGAYLRYVHFDWAYLRYAHFEGASLRYATLVRANMGGAFFSDASQLDQAVVSDDQGNCALLGGVHWNGVDLSGIDWSTVKKLGDEHRAFERTRRSDGAPKDRGKRLKDMSDAVRAYRQLAGALQSQGLSDDANRFAYHGQVIQKMTLLRKRQYGAYLVSWLLDLFAGYGYKPYRFFFSAIAVLVAFWAINVFIGGRLTILAILNALILSAQNLLSPDFRALGSNLLATVGAIEGLFGLFIAAVLIAIVTNRILNK